MMYLILALVVIISILSFVIFLISKKSKSLRQRVENAERDIAHMEENTRNYKKIITKLNQKDKESEELKDLIDHAYGSDLAILANSL